MQSISSFFKSALSEGNGTVSSTRIALWVVVAAIVGVVAYFIVRHTLTHESVDCPANIANLLSVTVGSLSAVRVGGRFAEGYQPPAQS
jgi:uncharacterized membrane protein YjfL (UPF0719 family)